MSHVIRRKIRHPPKDEGDKSDDPESPEPSEPEKVSKLVFTLSDDGKSYIVTGIGEETNLDLEIPAAYNELPVTGIGDKVFEGCAELKSVSIPDSVLSLGMYAFSGCSALKSVTLGENSKLEIIDYAAFSGCSELTSISIPNSLTKLGDSAFSGCTGLTSIIIPNSTTSIGNWAFYFCRGLTSVTFENTTDWWISGYHNATSGTSVDVTDAAQNVRYLTITYDNYYWERSE